jgi:hypothetical protein
MSKYTSIILFIPGSENEAERIREVNAYKLPNGGTINLIDVNKDDFPDIFPRFMYCGTYNYFPTANFIEYLKHNVNWEKVENIRVIVDEEANETLDYYTLMD